MYCARRGLQCRVTPRCSVGVSPVINMAKVRRRYGQAMTKIRIGRGKSAARWGFWHVHVQGASFSELVTGSSGRTEDCPCAIAASAGPIVRTQVLMVLLVLVLFLFLSIMLMLLLVRWL